MDWKNRLDQIKNKIKSQLNARGVDNLIQIQGVFNVRLKQYSRIPNDLLFVGIRYQ